MRKIIFALALGVLLLPDYGFTLGLGEIEVSTALNQELNAEIELLSAAPEDVETLIVKLAPREEFSRAGIDRPYLLNSLKFSAEVRDGVPIIRVTSDKPIREPFLNFLVEIDWPKGHMMREYTILLDPPVFMGQQQAPAEREETRPAAMESPSSSPKTTPEPQGGSGFRPSIMGTGTGGVTTAPAAPPSTQARAMPSPTATLPADAERTFQAPTGYRIQRGDTLWSLADAMRPDRSVAIEQMMLAIVRSNPEAFINDNVNGLKRGYVLRIPDRDDIIAVSQSEAIDLVREQHALWREYQEAVSGGQPTSALDLEGEDDAGMRSAEGADSRLEILAAGSGIAASGSKDPTQMSEVELRAELAIARESLETERVEKEEMQERIGMLEDQVEQMKALLTLEDTDLAEMQRAATPAASEDVTASEAFERAITAEQQAEEETFEQSLLEEGPMETAAPEEDVTIEQDVFDEIEQDVFVEQDQVEAAEQSEELIDQPITSTEDFSVKPSPQPAFMQPEQGPLAAFLNNPVLLAAAGGGLLLVLLLIALVMRRRKGGDEEPVVASNLEDVDEAVDEVAVAADEQVQAVDEVAEEIAEDSGAAVEEAFTEVAETQDQLAAATEDQFAAEETVVSQPAGEVGARDDVIAEADVYLAYGIYQQAEELLQNAIKQNPENDSYREKLAETYNSSRNAEAFIELATEVNQSREGRETPLWKKIVTFGTQLCPEHALFKAAAADKVGDLSMDDLASNQPDLVDIELDATEEQEALAPDLDLGSEDEDAELAAESPDSVEFDLAETGADAVVDEVVDEGVEFDLAETGAETVLEEDEDESVEFDLAETQSEEDADLGEEEFSLDIEATELGFDDEEPPAEQAADLDTDLDLDLSEEADALFAEADTSDEEFSLDDVEALDLDTDLGEETVESESAEDIDEPRDETDSILNLDDMDLDQAIVESVVEPGTMASADADDEELDLSDLDDIDEVGTKLDLAKAYLDMGDADGTRSILDEVMTEGDDTQKREAEELLRQIG
ncbi:MAG: hypothetical protein KJP15_03780 [Gammaproteobacteria bacterium]|nr:hypothetical protein [Gammaproteobacteria bacterium]